MTKGELMEYRMYLMEHRTYLELKKNRRTTFEICSF